MKVTQSESSNNEELCCPEEYIGKAQCGCFYHAEEGIPCEHDIALYVKDNIGKKD